MHDRLALTDPDRLDEHDIVTGGFEHDHRLAGGAGDATQRSGRRRGADERVGVDRQLGHAGLVTEDRATGSRT